MRKLFYEDCHLQTFEANVTDCESTPEGFLITLDATAFYPEGGGQACDIGTLGSVSVVDVQEKDGKILHLCSGPLTPGTTVTGAIDWQRRFDLMQQHTGEHIVSGLIHDAFGYHNSGFHVGQGIMEVDFDGPIPWEALMQIEAKANEAVWADLPVNCWVPKPEELPGIFYRTKRPLPWPVRLVQIPGYDSCACCGIHVGHTGEVGLIKILSCVKFHQGVRLEMVCGGRAYRYMAHIFEENRQVSQAFSVPMDATGSAAQKRNEQLSNEKFRCANLQKQIFSYIAKSYVNQENALHFEPGLESGQVRELAEAISGACRGYAAVFSECDGGFQYCLAQPNGDLRRLCKDMNAALNGRGGGKPAFQQGRVAADPDQIKAFFHDL